MIPENIDIAPCQFDDQERVAEYLIENFGSLLKEINSRASSNGMPELDIDDELRAADDFYFSNVELMDCCILAKDEGRIVGLCCVNPYTSTLQYLSVQEDYQRQGIGSRLLSLGKKTLSQRGCSHIKIEIPAELTTEQTLAFFNKNKVEEVSRTTLLSGKIF